MTYAIGWKTGNEVFLSADTAMTTRCDNPKLDIAKSSFGEKHFVNKEEKIEERLVKLFLKNDIGCTFAGNVQLALKIIETFYTEVINGSAPTEALSWAINLHNPKPLKQAVKIIIGYYKNHHPVLLTFNTNNDRKIRDNEDLVQVGSIPENFMKLTDNWIAKVLPNTLYEPKFHLSSMLGVFQAYSIFGKLIGAGVGGAFAGLYVDKSGGYWQSDIMFVIHKEDLISTCFRNDCFVINSPTIGQSRGLISHFPSQSLEVIKNQALIGCKNGKVVHEKAEFDFVIVVDKKGETLTLIEMAKNKKHEFLWLKPCFEPSGRTGTEIAIFPELNRIIQDKTPFKIVSYRKPKIKQIPKDRISRRVIKP